MPMPSSQVPTLLLNGIQTSVGEFILLKSPKQPKLSHIQPAHFHLHKNIQQNLSLVSKNYHARQIECFRFTD